MFSVKTPPEPGRIKELLKPEIIPKQEPKAKPPQKVRLAAKPPKLPENIPLTRTAFQRSIPRLRKNRKVGRIRSLPQQTQSRKEEMIIVGPSAVKLQHRVETLDTEPDLRDPPRYLNTIQSNLANRKRRR